jgi:uncharacterized RDD family membrane protein YckC
MDCPTGSDLAPQPQPSCENGMPEPPGCVATGTVDGEFDAEYWRREVAARLERYRARRKPRAPRYPSLRLPFDSAECWSRPMPASGPPTAAAAGSALACDCLALQMEGHPAPPPVRNLLITEEPDLSGNIIEFPRSAAIPVFLADELAEPVLERPRIVEAPEVLPAPPALGGILMEPAGNQAPERRAGADFALPSASLARRLLAGLLDGLILGVALAGFAAVFLRLNPELVPLPLLAGGLAVVASLLWAAYEFLLVVYTGSTPGLRAARLRLARFDGSPVHRRLRRWRVLASFLSALSLGLGYLWSVLDEDGLCWHDRITRTYVQSAPQTK